MAEYDDEGCDVCTSDMQDSELEDIHSTLHFKPSPSKFPSGESTRQ